MYVIVSILCQKTDQIFFAQLQDELFSMIITISSTEGHTILSYSSLNFLYSNSVQFYATGRISGPNLWTERSPAHDMVTFSPDQLPWGIVQPCKLLGLCSVVVYPPHSHHHYPCSPVANKRGVPLAPVRRSMSGTGVWPMVRVGPGWPTIRALAPSLGQEKG